MTLPSTLTKVKWTPGPLKVGLLRSTAHNETDISVSESLQGGKGLKIVPAPAWVWVVPLTRVGLQSRMAEWRI